MSNTNVLVVGGFHDGQMVSCDPGMNTLTLLRPFSLAQPINWNDKEVPVTAMQDTYKISIWRGKSVSFHFAHPPELDSDEIMYRLRVVYSNNQRR